MYIIIAVQFTWDELKNIKNKDKHGIWFEDAQRVFDDSSHRIFFDSENSTVDEQRFLILGIAGEKTVVVCFVEIEEENLVRIVSARLANKKEEAHYYER